MRLTFSNVKPFFLNVIMFFFVLQAYLKAVSTGKEDIREALRTCTNEELSKALVAAGPKLVHESTKTKKTIDTEEKVIFFFN